MFQIYALWHENNSVSLIVENQYESDMLLNARLSLYDTLRISKHGSGVLWLDARRSFCDTKESV